MRLSPRHKKRQSPAYSPGHRYLREHLLRRISRHSLSKSPKVSESIVHNPMFTRQWTRETFFNSVQNGGACGSYALRQLASICFEQSGLVERLPVTAV